jgi:tartrate dehydratase beta subunit/fumarate hydratase class I family protein
MGLFKKTKEIQLQEMKFEVRILKVNDIVFINGAIYKVESDCLQQLAVKPINQATEPAQAGEQK